MGRSSTNHPTITRILLVLCCAKNVAVKWSPSTAPANQSGLENRYYRAHAKTVDRRNYSFHANDNGTSNRQRNRIHCGKAKPQNSATPSIIATRQRASISSCCAWPVNLWQKINKQKSATSTTVKERVRRIATAEDRLSGSDEQQIKHQTRKPWAAVYETETLLATPIMFNSEPVDQTRNSPVSSSAIAAGDLRSAPLHSW